MTKRAKAAEDDAIPTFLKIPQAQRNATWAKTPIARPKLVELVQTAAFVPTVEPEFAKTIEEKKKAKTAKRITDLKTKLEWKSIPEQFRRWDPRRGKFVDERVDDKRRLEKAAEQLGVTLTTENDEMAKLDIVPYTEGQTLPVTRAKTTVKVDAPEWELHAKIRQAGIRAGKKLERVEVVDPEGLVTSTWLLDKESNLLTNGPVTIAMKSETSDATEQEKPTMAKKARATKAPKKKSSNGSGKPKGPGVIATIIETMQRDRGASADEIVAVLVKKFPDRKAKSMLSTVKIQANRNAKKKDKDDKRGIVYYG
jgi:hypothetical protein